MSHRRHERLSDKLPRPSCPTCRSDDPRKPKVTGYVPIKPGSFYKDAVFCKDTFHQSDTQSP